MKQIAIITGAASGVGLALGTALVHRQRVMSSRTKIAGSPRQVGREVRRFDRRFTRGRWGAALAERFGEEQAVVMRAEFLEEYRRLVPEIPNIGGRRNPHQMGLKGAVQGLAVYRVVQRHGGSVEDTGWLFHHWQRAELERVPRVIRHWAGRHRMLLGKTPRQFKKYIQRTQERRYPDDTVAVWVDSDGEPFDYGVDVTECAPLTFLQAQGAAELLPYMCELDFVLAEMMGFGMSRTKTLAWGCDKCDHRWVVGGTTTAPWPPRFVERTCGQPQETQLESVAAQ